MLFVSCQELCAVFYRRTNLWQVALYCIHQGFISTFIKVCPPLWNSGVVLLTIETDILHALRKVSYPSFGNVSIS